MSVSGQISVAVHMLMTTDRIGLAQKAFLGQLASDPETHLAGERTGTANRSVVSDASDPLTRRFWQFGSVST